MTNFIVIHGRLTADPELRQTQSGVSVCNFSVAVDRAYKQGEEKVADFFNVVCWRGLADMVSKHFTKGKEIVASGTMQSRKWVDNDGSNRVSWELIAQNVDFCGNKSSATDAPKATAESDFKDIPVDEDVPF